MFSSAWWPSVGLPQNCVCSFSISIFMGFLDLGDLILASTFLILNINPLSNVLSANIFSYLAFFCFSPCIFCYTETFYFDAVYLFSFICHLHQILKIPLRSRSWSSAMFSSISLSWLFCNVSILFYFCCNKQYEVYLYLLGGRL